MIVIRGPRSADARVLALGTFDGVHRGHRALLVHAVQYARENGVPLRVCTFDRHPMEVIRPGSQPELLSTIPERARRMHRLGVDEMELIPFTRKTAEMEPEAFLEQLRAAVRLRAVVAGWNYTFGKNGRGNAELLREDGARYGYDVLIEPPASLADGTVISSSLVRLKLKEGDAGAAAELLGYHYTMSGTVVNGKHQGRSIGFPTANIEPWTKKVLPGYGVYACLLETGDETMPALVNIGVQPTMPSGQVTVEAHALQGERELYGRKVRLTLLEMLREEKRFDSPEELKKQIERDREEAFRLFDMA